MIFLNSCVIAVFSFSIAITVAIGGPLALNVTGILKDVFLTYAGFIFFNDAQLTTNVVVGLALSFTGAVLCVHSKFKAGKTGDKSENSQD